MAPIDKSDGKKAYNVLVTGFGPFGNYERNPSWLGVAPLHGTTVPTETHTISFTCFRVPTSYAAILALIPPVHARPPVLPNTQYPASPTGSKPPYDESDPAPLPMPDAPEDGYDLVIHVGAGMPGALALEKQGHKTGYRIPDWDGKLPEVVEDKKEEEGVMPSKSEWEEMKRLGLGWLMKKEERRGFGKGYEQFEEVVKTRGDVKGLVEYIKANGLENSRVSDDAGHYSCDFIYYCSLAESMRLGKDNGSKVQFMHIPPPGKPYVSKDVTEAIKHIATWYSLGL